MLSGPRINCLSNILVFPKKKTNKHLKMSFSLSWNPFSCPDGDLDFCLSLEFQFKCYLLWSLSLLDVFPRISLGPPRFHLTSVLVTTELALGAPRWLIRLSVQLQLRSWSHGLWVPALCQALHWQCGTCLAFSPSPRVSLSAPPPLACTHSLSINKETSKTKTELALELHTCPLLRCDRWR